MRGKCRYGKVYLCIVDLQLISADYRAEDEWPGRPENAGKAEQKQITESSSFCMLPQDIVAAFPLTTSYGRGVNVA